LDNNDLHIGIHVLVICCL